MDDCERRSWPVFRLVSLTCCSWKDAGDADGERKVGELVLLEELNVFRLFKLFKLVKFG